MTCEDGTAGMQPTTLDQHRDQMLKHLAEDRAYAFLMLADPYLRVRPADDYVRLMTIRTYVTLGLIRPALELVESATETPTNASELAALRSKLSAIVPAKATWQSMAMPFEANLAALATRGEDVAAIRAAWANASARYERYVDTNRQHQIRRRDDDGQWRWFPGIRHHDKTDRTEKLPKPGNERFPLPIAFNGVGLGGMFERAYRETANTFLGYSSAIYIIEPDPADWALALHYVDWTEILTDPRVQLFIGPSWHSRLLHHATHAFDVPLPAHALSIGPRAQADAEPDVLEAIRETYHARDEIIHNLQTQVTRRYEGRGAAYYAKRFSEALDGSGRPLRVLATTSARTTFLQYSMRDALRALEALGCEYVLLKEEHPHEVISPQRYYDAILDVEPDLMFVLDHLRAGFGAVLPESLPLLTWDQDQLPHVFTKDNIDAIAPIDFVAGYSKRRCLELGADPSQLLYCDVPTCPEQFSQAPLTDAEHKHYACDMSYVSHASQTPAAFHEEERTHYNDPQVRRLLDELFTRLPPLIRQHGGPHYALLETVMLDAIAHCHITRLNADLQEHLVRWYLWRLGDRLFRHEALAWAARWAEQGGHRLRIYGNGWEDHPTLSKFAAGPAENGRELFCVYRASTINLQLMPAGFIHQRALDGIAAGAFFLSRKAPFDLRGRLIRTLVDRMRQLNITTTDAFLSCRDRTITETFSTLYGPLESHARNRWPKLCDLMYIAGESTYPDEVFDGFDRIVFDSADTLAARADAFLHDDGERARIAESMREVVVDRFSYRSTMTRLLEGMAAHLRRAAEREKTEVSTPLLAPQGS